MLFPSHSLARPSHLLRLYIDPLLAPPSFLPAPPSILDDSSTSNNNNSTYESTTTAATPTYLHTQYTSKMQITIIALLALAATAIAKGNKCSTCYTVGEKQCTTDGASVLQCSVQGLGVCWENAEDCKKQGKTCKFSCIQRFGAVLT
jgi:hypothetical protein